MSNTDDDHIVDIETDGEALSGFERKYKDQMRQIVTQRLDLPISTLPAMLESSIQINPSFQRRDRWDSPRQSRLIESLLMNVPIPPIFLGEDQYGHYVVLDGRQRLTAIKSFLNNTLVLESLDVWSDLNGMRFDDLLKRGLDRHVTRRFLSAIVLLKESSPLVKYDVFDRLNTGGVKANDMEVRNAIFQGGFTNALHDLSASAVFCNLWSIPIDRIEAQNNLLYQKMHDLSIVLRFFALAEPARMEGSFKGYLGDYMNAKNLEYASDAHAAARDAQRFHRAMENTWQVFGERAFRNPTKRNTGVKSAPLADAVSNALADVQPESLTEPIIERLRSGFEELCQNADFSKAISTGTNGKGAITTRITLAKDLVASIVR